MPAEHNSIFPCEAKRIILEPILRFRYLYRTIRDHRCREPQSCRVQEHRSDFHASQWPSTETQFRGERTLISFPTRSLPYMALVSAMEPIAEPRRRIRWNDAFGFYLIQVNQHSSFIADGKLSIMGRTYVPISVPRNNDKVLSHIAGERPANTATLKFGNL